MIFFELGSLLPKFEEQAMNNTTKLFKSAKGSNEQERANDRTKNFTAEYNELQTEWYQRLVDLGLMKRTDIFHNAGDLHLEYDLGAETQFNIFSVFLHRGNFHTGRTACTKRCPDCFLNKKIWSHFVVGTSSTEIAKLTNISARAVEYRIKQLKDRAKQAKIDGKLEAIKCLPNEIEADKKRKALKTKHQNLIRSKNFASNLAEAETFQTALVGVRLDEEAVEAINHSTAMLALAFTSREG